MPSDPTVIVPTMEGVTTALVLFIFACVIYPSLVKNKAQFYAAFIAVLIIILLNSLNIMIRGQGFGIFAGAVTGLLQLAALILLFASAGGLSIRELAGEFGKAYEVIRRGESEKTVIVPLSGEMPRPRQQPAGHEPSPPASGAEPAPTAETIDLPADAGWPKRTSSAASPPSPAGAAPPPPGAPPSPPPDTSSIPLE